MTVSLASLLIRETKAAIYATALSIARALNLPVDAWQAGDPTRSLYHVLSEVLSTLEGVVSAYVGSGFLDYATGDWLTLLAKQIYNVDREVAAYAETTFDLTNAGGGVYDFEPGDLTVKCTATGKTYRNSSGGHLAALGGVLSVDIVADEPGSDSSAAAGEIDDLVTGYIGVTGSNPTAAVGVDEQTDDSLRQQCRDKVGALSPDGPAAAYSFVAKSSALTGTTAVTRVRVYADSDTGDVTVYLAGPSGAVASGDRDVVETAILRWATPLCITPTVLSASNVTIAVTYQLWIYEGVNKTSLEIQTSVAAALATMFAKRPIGGDIIPPATTGALYKEMIESTIRTAFPDHTFKIAVSIPASYTAMTNGQVPALGVIASTVTFVADP
jgi:phage-related baseplate assembly protein